VSPDSPKASYGVVTPKGLGKKYRLEEGARVLLIPSGEGIVLKHRVLELKCIRGIMRKEVDLPKASKFIKELRKVLSDAKNRTSLIVFSNNSVFGY